MLHIKLCWIVYLGSDLISTNEKQKWVFTIWPIICILIHRFQDSFNSNIGDLANARLVKVTASSAKRHKKRISGLQINLGFFMAWESTN